MGHPNSSFTLGIPRASADGRYYSRFPQGDKSSITGNASAQLTTAVSVALAVVARGDVVNPFDFVDALNVAPSALVESNAVTPTGFLSPVTISVSGGSYRIGSGAYTTAPGLLSPGNAVQVRATASSAFSGTTTVTLTVGPRVVDWKVTTFATAGWPNWPWINFACCQGTGPAVLDPSHSADRDALIFTSSDPTPSALQTRCDGIDAIWAQQDTSKIKTKMIQYVWPSVTAKTLPFGGEHGFSLSLINDPINGSPLISGSPRWKVHRVGQPGDAGLCETSSDSDLHQVNITAGAGLNTLGEDYATALWKKYDNAWSVPLTISTYKDRLWGFFHDVFNQVPENLTQNNGATTVTDPDYNNDGVIDVSTNFNTSGGNGGRQWALGMLNTQTKFKARFPDKHVFVNAARLDLNPKVLPLYDAPYYRQLEFPLDESCNVGMSLTPTSTGWAVSGTPGGLGRITALYTSYYQIETTIKPESELGSDVKGAYLFHSRLGDRVANSADIEVMRFICLASLMVERGAPCVTWGTKIVGYLDELIVELGAPIGTRSMGTFDEATGVLTLRAPDFTSGVAKFFWARFTKAIAIIRVDTPSIGVYPSADPAVSIPLSSLPNPGVGKKYQYLGPGYTNPLTLRSTRNQSPTLNTGLDVGPSGPSLKPYHGVLLRIV